MNQTKLVELMHTVLDGESTAEQTRDLESRLAADPAARAQFDELRMLFDDLKRVPMAFPPEGLVASVLASAPRQPTRPGRVDQLFTQPRVFEQTSGESRTTSAGRSAGVQQAGVSRSRSYFKGENMSELNNGFLRKRNVWIGGGIAAVAAILAISYGMNMPPDAKDAVGTIVPAQRYRATQNMADGVNGAPATAQSTQTIPAAQNALAGQAESNAVNSATTNAVNNATANAVESATAKAVDSATAKAVDSATAKAVDSATAKAVDSATAKAVDSATAKAVDSATAKAVDSATAKAVDSATAKAVDSATANAVDSATAKAVDSATTNAVNNATNNAVNNATTNAVNNATAKAVDAATAKAVNNATFK